MVGVTVELERSRVDRSPFRPADGGLRGNDVEQVHPPRGALDDLATTGTPFRDVVADDRPDVDAHDLHRADGIGTRGVRLARHVRSIVRQAGPTTYTVI